MRSALATITLLVLAGCGDTGQRRVSFPVAAAGTAPEELEVGEHRVLVEEARVAFGPVYLCATALPGVESCSEAIAEQLGTTSFDALGEEPVPMGPMQALAGTTVLSGMWDYGRSWRVSETTPRPSPGAVDGAHSAVLVVRATRAGVIRRYRMTLDVDGGSQPSGSTATRARLADHVLGADERGLTVRFDPTLWASMIDYDALAALPAPEPPDAPLDVPEGHVARAAVVAAMTATGLPTFEWASPD
jgi:hypothetical protein